MALPGSWVRKLTYVNNSEAFELIYSLGKTCQNDSKVNFNMVKRIKSSFWKRIKVKSVWQELIIV